jgi:hypothetical protein
MCAGGCPIIEKDEIKESNLNFLKKFFDLLSPKDKERFKEYINNVK